MTFETWLNVECDEDTAEYIRSDVDVYEVCHYVYIQSQRVNKND